ncbi:MAG TPA: endonuclease/exonuclease/phosphatase family protein [Chlamydiales bacterium]|nr:endonuclease/exonuclease/phosphatase family protein [Chlamydiales bacterium]
MKIVSLNTWGGIVYQPLLDFIKEEARSADVFCLQELLFGESKAIGKAGQHLNLCQEIAEILRDFHLFPMYAPVGTHFQEEAVGVRIGQGIFVRKGIEVLGVGELRTYAPDSEIARNLELTLTGNFNYVKVAHANSELLISNLHGLWQEEGKVDTAPRLEQSRILNQFFDTVDVPVVFCGDFNLRPDTESMSLLETRLCNLVKKHQIDTTRSKFYKKVEKFADYVLVSPDLKVDQFDVPAVCVSDHLPLRLCIFS